MYIMYFHFLFNKCSINVFSPLQNIKKYRVVKDFLTYLIHHIYKVEQNLYILSSVVGCFSKYLELSLL